MKWAYALIPLLLFAFFGAAAFYISSRPHEGMSEFQRDENRWLRREGYGLMAVVAIGIVLWLADYVL